MGLHIYVFRTEDRRRPFDGEVFDYVRIFTSAVISPAGISFSVFIGKDRTLSIEHRFAYVIFRGDKDYLLVLPASFLFDRLENLRIGRLEIIHFRLSLNLLLFSLSYSAFSGACHPRKV